MHAERIEEAGVLAKCIQTDITRHSTAWLRNVNTRKNAKDAWTKVREIMGGRRRHEGCRDVDGISAQILNDHCAAIPTDRDYQATPRKLSAPKWHAHTTVTYSTISSQKQLLNGIPVWFLQVGAAISTVPIAQLFNQSVLEGIVVQQWKAAIITPVPKVSKPEQPRDFRPMSITSVLS